MKVAPKELETYYDTSKTIEFNVPEVGNPYLVQHNTHNQTSKLVWSNESRLFPSQVLISKELKKVILIGGLGEPGFLMGSIRIFSFEGKKLIDIDLKKEIPDFEKLCNDFRKKMPHFPWISSRKISADEKMATVGVCKVVMVHLDLESFSVKFENKAHEADSDIRIKGLM